MRVIFAAALAAVLAGCAATGVKVTEEQLAAFKTGETTEAQVVARLGPPNGRTRLPDGTVMLHYFYVETAVRPATFIPIVGAFVGGADSRSNSVMLRFDSAGKLASTTSSSSTYGTGQGVAAGQVDTSSTQQPRQ